jgi:ankyrin repeat protein
MKLPKISINLDFLHKPMVIFTEIAVKIFGGKKTEAGTSLDVHLAAEKNDLKRLKIILSLSNPCFDLPDEKGDTPLFYAAKSGHLEVVEFLINQKASVNHTNIFGKTAIFAAAEHSHLEVIDFLEKNGADLNRIDENKQNILHAALLTEQHASLVFLLEYGTISLNHRDKFGQTPLILAADKQLLSSAKLLIAKGSEIDNSDNDGWTALMFCAKRGNTELMATLIASGASLSAHDIQFHQTPYLIACRHSQIVIMEILLKNKANPLDRDYYDRTALHIAVEINKLDVVKFVLKTPVDLSLKDRFGMSAHDWAVVNASADILKVIRDYKGHPN